MHTTNNSILIVFGRLFLFLVLNVKFTEMIILVQLIVAIIIIIIIIIIMIIIIMIIIIMMMMMMMIMFCLFFTDDLSDIHPHAVVSNPIGGGGGGEREKLKDTLLSRGSSLGLTSVRHSVDQELQDSLHPLPRERFSMRGKKGHLISAHSDDNDSAVSMVGREGEMRGGGERAEEERVCVGVCIHLCF